METDSIRGATYFRFWLIEYDDGVPGWIFMADEVKPSLVTLLRLRNLLR